ncbi:hypothetical protein VNO77_01738 [Canavalia gladiata]|uniref:Uncharacterized protein n=1 Tax=Canavalia gladiata TaxID=3824 RepID=A0AAN9MWL0_CANGL
MVCGKCVPPYRKTSTLEVLILSSQWSSLSLMMLRRINGCDSDMGSLATELDSLQPESTQPNHCPEKPKQLFLTNHHLISN